MRRRSVFAPLLGLAVIAAGCGTSASTTSAPENIAKPPFVYVAIGGSESLETGSRAAFQTAWSQLLYRTAIGTAGTFYDLAEPNETAAEAAALDPSQVRALHPDLVTVWLSTADLLDGTPVAAYRRSLGTLLRALRATETTVLVASAPPIERLPLYQACIDDPRACGSGNRTLPSPASLPPVITAYNTAIAGIASRSSATVINVGAPLVKSLGAVAGAGALSTNFATLSAGAARAVASAFEVEVRRLVARR
ncbi:MAG TPA: SGNH/GDSL hydrolase family protein [Acidimicrobiales bacterium]|nr:SGNH/GDSL hydrolase family protein [Acidimicrobiales bacterium]